ncbi:MAG: CPBP family intramembrane metalloprotease [Chitinophagaceae bacterium]|nr:MAG: CPBP family intramembrane metalloprotease [Chitinophagaceae bacterium]
MSRYLKQQPLSFQLIVIIGIYIGLNAIYYLLFMGFLMPHWTGITAFDLQNGDLKNAYLLEVMKWMQMLYSVFTFLVPALIFFYLSDPEPLRYGGFRGNFRLTGAMMSIVVLLLAMPAVGVLGDWNQHIHFGSLDQTFRQLNQKATDLTNAMLQMKSWGSMWYDMVLIAVIPAIAEEAFFRGVLQRLFIRMSKRAWIGILIASVVFSLLHAEMLGFFPRAALGIVLGLIYYFSGNIWYSILAHFINNGLQVFLLFLFQHHYIKYNINTNEPTPLIAGIISFAVVIGLFIVFWKFIKQYPVPGIFAKQAGNRELPLT